MQIIRASAGSGKTYRLAYEYIRNIIKEPYNYRHILAVTFTNKATDEMKWRILSELYLLSQGGKHGYTSMLLEDIPEIRSGDIPVKAKQGLSLILHDYSNFNILTIDRFFQKILHSFIRELGIESDYTINFDYDYLLSLAIDKLINSINNDGDIKICLTEFMDDNMLKGKSFNSLRDELVKFSYIIFSEEFAGVDTKEKKNLLKEFFVVLDRIYKEAIGELRLQGQRAVDYIAEQGLSTDDFHFKKGGFVNYFYLVAAGEFSDYKIRVVQALDYDSKWGNEKITPEIKTYLHRILTDICGFWDSQKRFIITAAESLRHYHTFMLLSDISSRLETLCVDNNIMLLPFTTKLLSTLIADNDTPFIYEKCGNSYSKFMIDEFQDTSKGQWRNFVPLLNNAIATSERESDAVTLVGDVKQSIYRWRGGDWRLLQGDVYNDIPKDDISEKFLDTNWRSLYNIVSFNNALIRKVVAFADGMIAEFLKPLRDRDTISECQSKDLSVMLLNAYENMEQRCAKQTDADKGYVRVQVCDFEQDDNLLHTIHVIEELQQRGYKAGDIAVLVRDNKEARNVANYILQYKLSVDEFYPYNLNIVSEDALQIKGSQAVEFIISCMKLSCEYIRGTYPVAIVRYNTFLGRGISCVLTSDEMEFINSLRVLSPTESFERILARYNDMFTQLDIAYIQALHDYVIGFSSQNIADLSMFIDWWEKDGIKKNINLSNEQDSIIIQTIHKSKGLEYKVVVLPFMSWGLEPKFNPIIQADTENEFFNIMTGMPIKYSEKLSQSYFSYPYAKERSMSYIENINILYVALTRAERELYIIMPEKTKKDNISNLILSSITSNADGTASITNSEVWCNEIVNSISGVVDGMCYEFGDRVVYIGNKKHTDINNIVTSYPSEEYSDRIRLKLETERYSELFNETLSARSYGILIHKLFERIETLSDIPKVMRQMLFDGELNDTLAEKITDLVSKAMQNRSLSQLFDSQWRVYNEHNILIPGTSRVQRPDRVVVNGDKAYVLDYKFGTKQNDDYIKQVREYMCLLRDMGYADVKGFIWYIRTENIIEVSI